MTDNQKKVVSDMLDTIKLLEQQNKQLIETLESIATTYKNTICGMIAENALKQIQGKE